MRLTRTRPVRSAPPPIARVAAEVFAQLARRTKYVDPALAERWSEIAGEEIAALCRPGRLSGPRQTRTLEVRAPSGAAAAQLQMRTEELRARVNAYLGPGAIARIAVRQAAATAPSGPAEEADGGLKQALSAFRAAVGRRNGGK